MQNSTHTNPAQNIDIRTFGAVGDGQTDCTDAIQRALDEAGKIHGTVFVPDGTFLTGMVKMPPHTGLVGNCSWGYRSVGGSVLKLNDATAHCLIDFSGAVGATVNGLSLEGSGLGQGIHGLYAGPVEDKKEEDTQRVERCHISGFTGDGIHLNPIWCFSVRGCEIIFNKGNALYVRGWDGFILDNWFSGNGGAGYFADEANASITMTGNRIEWNANGGIRILNGGGHYNITGNYIDRSGGPGIVLLGGEGSPCFCFTVTGNVIYRSGKPEWTQPGEEFDSAHARFENVHGLVFSGNSMCAGQDDGGGAFSPQYGIVLRALKNCVIKDNTLNIGALREILIDRGEHDEGVVIKDNVGNLYVDKGTSLWGSGQL